ncbi:hypothetical protein FQZ97_668790 [compost metagenome]
MGGGGREEAADHFRVVAETSGGDDHRTGAQLDAVSTDANHPALLHQQFVHTGAERVFDTGGTSGVDQRIGHAQAGVAARYVLDTGTQQVIGRELHTQFNQPLQRRTTLLAEDAQDTRIGLPTGQGHHVAEHRLGRVLDAARPLHAGIAGVHYRR